MNWPLLWGIVLLMIAAYAVGKGIGRAQGHEAAERNSKTTIVLQLGGEHVGHVVIEGVTVLPGCDYLPLHTDDDTTA